MAYESENIVREWMNHLKGLNIEVKRCLAVIASTVMDRQSAGFMMAL